MKFLVDAQLPRRLAQVLSDTEDDTLHTIDLPRGNATPDAELCKICLRESRVLVTKDSDFADSYYLKHEPPRILLISTGNITNRELEELVRAHLPEMVKAFGSSAFLELDRSGITIRA